MSDPIPPADGGDPIASLLAKLRLRDELGMAEENALRTSIERIETVAAGRNLVTAGQPLHHSILLIDGLVSRFNDLKDGQRQITELHVPGDFVDLHGFLLKHLDHHIGALTPVRVAYVPHDRLKRISEEHPHLSRLLWLGTLIDSSIQRQRILSIGRRMAASRIGHLLCELLVRLEVVGLTEGNRFALPLTQTDLADATGLTSVHVNRMLRQLRDDGLVTMRGGMVQIHDLARLERVAEFDRTYLFLEKLPR